MVAQTLHIERRSMLSVRAHFDGKQIQLDEPVKLKPDTRLLITVLNEEKPEDKTLFELLEAPIGNIEGPEDWSVNHDHYLYGVSKKQ